MRKMLKKLGVVIPSVVLTLLMAVGFSTPACVRSDIQADHQAAEQLYD